MLELNWHLAGQSVSATGGIIGFMARGRLRVYLGAAPGVGKTYAMLGEGQRRRVRGTDVVVGFVESHGRAHTAEMIGDLEVVPCHELTYRGATFTEMDLDAVLGRRPEQALVDELAHTNVLGSRNTKRWQDVEELLEAGIDVVSTVSIEHLESLSDVVEVITGVRQQETIPDEVVRRADQIELVDMTAEALRRRMAHGNVYPADRFDAALARYFRVGNLTALRELALLWLADRVEEGLQEYRAEHGISGVWESRERVVVALSGGAEGRTLIRRAARVAARSVGGELLAVHVTRSDGLTGAPPAELDQQRALVESLGGSYHQVVGEHVPQALLEFARGCDATQLVLGTSRRPRWARMLAEGVGATTTALSGPIDVHLVTHEATGTGRGLPRLGGGLSRRRRVTGYVLALAGLPLLTLALTALREQIGLSGGLQLFLLAVIGVALVGGLWPALLAAVLASVLLNFYFTPPLSTLTIAEPADILALVVFLVAAVAVSTVVDQAARRTRQAARARAEVETLRTLAGSVLRGENAVTAMLDRTREAFGMTTVTLLEQHDSGWRQVAHVGPDPSRSPADGTVDLPVLDRLRLVLRGRALPAEDRLVLDAFAASLAVAVERGRLAEQAAEAHTLAETDKARSALLAAVGHDLRTPLASIKAAVSSLRATDVTWTPEDEQALLATIEESTDRLDDLIANLLDMSRLQAGAIPLTLRPTHLAEAVLTAVATLPGRARVAINNLEHLAAVNADQGLLERIVANLVSNALRYAPERTPIEVRASTAGEVAELRVVDHGTGIPTAKHQQVFTPFQRLDDNHTTAGVGLGLAVARGFTEAMGGHLTPEDTPGGGLTMVLTLPLAHHTDSKTANATDAAMRA